MRFEATELITRTEADRLLAEGDSETICRSLVDDFSTYLGWNKQKTKKLLAA